MSDAASLALDAELVDALISAGTAFRAVETTYTPPGGAAVSCRVMIDDLRAESIGDRARTVGTRREVHIVRADVATPVRGAVLVLDGADWRLADFVAAELGLSTWVVSRER